MLNNRRQEPAQYIPPAMADEQNIPAKTVITYARGMDETEAALKIIEEFNRQSDSVTVKYQELPYDEGERYNQIKRWLSSGDSSIDIFDVNMTWCAEFAQNGYARTLDSYARENNINLENYNHAVVNGCRYDGALWAMPRIIYTGLFFYRRDIVDTPPAHWDDFISSAKWYNGENDTKYGYVFSGKVTQNLVNEAMEFIYSYGGKIIDDDGNIAVNSPESINGLNKFYEIYNGGFVPDTEYKMTEIDACISFLNGESVYMRNVPSAWSVLNTREDSKVVGKFAIAPLPAGSAGSFSVLSGYVSVINAKSANPDAAWEFIEYISGYEGQKMLSVISGRIPAMTAVLADAEVIEANPHFDSDIFRETLDTAVPNIITPHHKVITGVMQDELYLFLTGKKDASAALTSMEAKIRALLA
jgi:multiple sugar transport system substrate-binding protein